MGKGGGVKGEAARVSQELAGGHGEINKPTVGRHSTARQHSWLSYHGQTTQWAVTSRPNNTVGRHITARPLRRPSASRPDNTVGRHTTARQRSVAIKPRPDNTVSSHTTAPDNTVSRHKVDHLTPTIDNTMGRHSFTRKKRPGKSFYSTYAASLIIVPRSATLITASLQSAS